MLSHRFRTLRGMLEHRASNGSENVWYGLMVQLGGLFQARITQQKMKMAYPSSGIYIYIHTYITLHYITLHYITLHYITYIHTHTHIHTYIHCITLHYIALHCITLHYIALHYITLPYIHTLHIYIYIYILLETVDEQEVHLVNLYTDFNAQL